MLFTAVDFALGPGDCLQVIGANGSGKTALLRILAGLSPAEQGEVCVPKDGILVGHKTGIKAQVTPVEHLQFMTKLYGTEANLASIHSALERVGLYEMKYCGQLSMGQQRRLALAVLLLVPASLWLLDEPLSYLDQAGQGLLSKLMRQYLKKGGRCVFSSHQPVALNDVTVDSIFLEEYQWNGSGPAFLDESPYAYGRKPC